MEHWDGFEAEMGEDDLESVKSGMSQLEVQKKIYESVDSRQLYKNFSDIFWFSKGE